MPVKDEHKKTLEQHSQGNKFIYSSYDNVTQEMVQEANVIIGNVDPFYLQEAKNLEWLQLNSAGADPYVKKGVLPEDVILTNATGAYGPSVAEISINSFFINYVVDDGWMNARDASVVLSFGGLGLFMCGRFAGSWIMRYIRAEKVLFVCAIGTVVSTSLVVLNLGILSLIALFLGYAFEAIMFPTIFALSLRGLGNYTKRASSYLMMSPIGGAVGPLMMGYVADQTNMSFSFIVPLLSFIVVLLYAWKVKQRSFC